MPSMPSWEDTFAHGSSVGKVAPVIACTYRIVVEGEFDDLTAAAFPDLACVCEDGMTVLQTDAVDQAALSGILDRLRSVGATLVSLGRAQSDASPVSR
jgi:hypothetical protein